MYRQELPTAPILSLLDALAFTHALPGLLILGNIQGLAHEEIEAVNAITQLTRIAERKNKERVLHRRNG
jgi:hypothetical protein